MALTKERIISFAQCTTQPRKAGIEGYFLQIDKNWGLKYYYEKRDAQVIYARQRWMSEALNIAPKVAAHLGVFSFWHNSQTNWAYVTEIVSVASRDPRFLQEKNVDARFVCSFDNNGARHYGILSHKHPLVKSLLAEGFVGRFQSSPYDLHSENIGYRADGQLVILDCGFGSSEDIVRIESTDIYRILKSNNIKFADFVSGERE